MKITITAKQFRQLWKVALDKNSNNPRLKDRAFAICQAVQYLSGKEFNTKLIKELAI